MSKKKICAVIILIIFAVLSNYFILNYVKVSSVEDASITFNIDIEASDSDYIQVYYSDKLEFAEEKSAMNYFEVKDGKTSMTFPIDNNNPYLRLDLGNKPLSVTLSSAYLEIYNSEYPIEMKDVFSASHNLNQINNIVYNSDGVTVDTSGLDSYVLLMYNTEEVNQIAIDEIGKRSMALNVIFCVLIDVIFLLCIRKLDSFLELPLEIAREKKLIWNLSKNDFKTKYAGSYLGIVWAFVHPVITVLVYWFVFEVGLKSGRVSEYPFILFLMSGLVPWFFFSDALNGGTTSLIEYNYLVKKVVFNIGVLPVVKIVSALFVHIFFVFVVGLICVGYGYSVDIYWLQIPYYIICTIVCVLGLIYLTSTIVCFFRDLTQIISIVLQVGMWITPIMWQVTILSPTLQTVFKLNPMYYVVEGYRNALLGKEWFWEDMTWTIYFWIIAIVGLGIGTTTFRRLRVHFADVL